jgi:hypothetical protein
MPVEWEPKETAAAPDRLREGRVRLEEDYAHRRVPLRNGAGEMAVGKAAAAEAELRTLLKHDLLPALRALADGRRGEVSREQVKELREWGAVTGSGRVRGDLQMALKASYEEKDGKPSIVAPFDMTNPNDAAAVMKWRDWSERTSARAQALIKRLGEAEAEREGRGRS